MSFLSCLAHSHFCSNHVFANAYTTHGVVPVKNMSTDKPRTPWEFRPIWKRRETPPYWRKMHPCRCLHGPRYCDKFSVPYYDYLSGIAMHRDITIGHRFVLIVINIASVKRKIIKPKYPVACSRSVGAAGERDSLWSKLCVWRISW